MSLEMVSDRWGHSLEALLKFSSRLNIRNPVKCIFFEENTLLGSVFGLLDPLNLLLLDPNGVKSFSFCPCDKMVSSKKS